MPTETGAFSEQETNEQYAFSYPLARWIGKFLPKNEPVIDFGCGRASYLAYLQDIGFTKVVGIEGEQQHFEIHTDNIRLYDLTKQFELDFKGNVICLEVGEHIPKWEMSNFLQNIFRHCNNKLILSWAVREQGGLGHVNCLDNIAVIDMIEANDFKLNVYQSIKARDVIDNIAPWFKHSLMIFEKLK